MLMSLLIAAADDRKKINNKGETTSMYLSLVSIIYAANSLRTPNFRIIYSDQNSVNHNE